MGWGYRILGGTAAVLGAASLACALLTLLPGLLLPESGWLVGVSMGSGVLLGMVAVGWSFTLGNDPRLLWMAFRCLSGKVQAALGVLAVTSAPLMPMGLSSGHGLQNPETEYGAYHAFDTTTRERVEIFSRAEYEALVELEQRTFLGGGSLFLFVAAALFLSMGELRRR